MNPTWLSRSKCGLCKGSGNTLSGRSCGCVLRQAFRLCLERFHLCGEFPSTSFRRFSRGAEYRVDFLLVVRRVLDPVHALMFDICFIHGLDWRWGGRIAGVDRGNFFHQRYQVEQLAGAALIESGIFPPSSYFGGIPRHSVAGPLARRPSQEKDGSDRIERDRAFSSEWGCPTFVHFKPGSEGGENLRPWPSRLRIPLRAKARAAA